MLAAQQKTVADPCDSYDSIKELWVRSRAVCRGEKYVKRFDSTIDRNLFKNLLIPFSPSMTDTQYAFYKAEAELPGISGQFGKTLVGGLLRKAPTLKLPDGVPVDSEKWIMHSFGRDDSPLTTFMDEILWEEIQTSRSWIFVDYPNIDGEIDVEEAKFIKPYPVIQKAENIVNWKITTDNYGKTILAQVIVAGYTESFDINEFHPTLRDTRWIHELVDGVYQIRIMMAEVDAAIVSFQNGERQLDLKSGPPNFVLIDTIVPKMNGESIIEVPAWPLNGQIEPSEPLLTPIIDKEIALYNKISRRNHLMYGAATYTPVVMGNITDDQFDAIVEAGLGSWIHVPDPEGKVDIMKSPTEALQDMEKAIASGYEEIAKLGVRMLAPESGDQSGVALELRNASQTAQMSSLNTKVSNTMRQVITFMINWRYNLKIDSADVEFTLSNDFIATQKGADWLRLATEWYQSGLIPRSDWIFLLQQNDMLRGDYHDEDAIKDINNDELIVTPKDQHETAASQFASTQEQGLKAGNT